MSVKHSTFLRILITAAFSFFGRQFAFSATDPIITQPIKGSKDSVHVNAESFARDMKYFSLSQSQKSGIQNNQIINMVGLSIDESASTVFQSSFSISMVLEITTYDENEQPSAPFTRNFSVAYDTASGARFKSQDYYTFSNAYAVKVKIISIDSGSVLWPVSRVLNIENQISVNRDYPFDCYLALGNLQIERNATVDEAVVTWNPPAISANPGVTEYDLEWAWIEFGALPRYKSGNDFLQELLFSDNASRVSTSSFQYNIPLLYDDTGWIFVRVRPVQITASGRRIEGIWTWIQNNNTQPGAYQSPVYYEHLDGHHPELNWQASTSFAEEGKRKSVVQYFDGSLRSRQTVTKDNSSQTTVVAETFYDFQGRAVIQVLPAPTLDNAIGYARNFNQAIGHNTYPKSVYDHLNTGTICNSPASPFNTNFGTAKYYSSRNPLLAQPLDYQSKQIPDASDANPDEAYPFTETRFTPDGQVSLQSGVGFTHQIGSGHETKYYYESPGQDEIDALFGTDVGIASHYSKNIVSDANGQFSVSYTDMQGRTIATALAGETPRNANQETMLDQLPGVSSSSFTRQLLDGETNRVVGKSIVSSKSFVVTKDNMQYTFSYQLTPKQLSLLTCIQGQPACYDCMYKVQFILKSACDDQDIINETISNVQLNNIPSICNLTSGNTALGFNHSMVRVLNKGEYTITKILTIDEDAQAKHRQEYLLKSTCKSLEQMVTAELQTLQANSNCNITCESCNNAIGANFDEYKAKFMTQMPSLTLPLSGEILAQLEASYREARQRCESICDNADGMDLIRSTRQMMLQDVTPPSGQYARLSNRYEQPNQLFENNNYNIFKFNDQTNYGTGQSHSASSPDYRYPMRLSENDQTVISIGQYVDGFGNNNTPPGLSVMNSSDFSNIFDPSWAEQLLIHHPEFKKLQLAKGVLAASYEFEALVQKTETWAEAGPRGFIDDIVNRDPFFNGPGQAYRTRMLNGNHNGPNPPPLTTNLSLDPIISGVNNYSFLKTTDPPCSNPTQNGNITFSMWQVALAAVFCKDKSAGPNCSLDYSDPATQLGCLMNSAYLSPLPAFNEGCEQDRDQAWKIFRQLYLNERRKFISAYLNAQAGVFPGVSATAAIKPYIPRFVNYANMQSIASSYGLNQLDDLLNTANANLQNGQAQALEIQQEQFVSTCNAYAATWISELRKCPEFDAYYNSSNWSEEKHKWIIDRLVAICVKGSDATHPQGSSTINPSGSPAVIDGQNYYDFQQVIEEFFSGIPFSDIQIANPTANCFKWMISVPKPYEVQTSGVTTYIVTKPDECDCKRISDVRFEWEEAVNASLFTGTFAAYMQYKYGTYISNDQLNALTSLCDGSFACEVTEEPIPLPPTLQCASTYPAPGSCINCNEYQEIRTSFNAMYPNIGLPFHEPQNQIEIDYNYSFAAYVNIRTGLNLRWTDYVAFERSCSNVNPPIGCESMTLAHQQFITSPQYQQNPVGMNCIQAMVSFFNSYYSVNYSYDFWRRKLLDCGLENVCLVKVTCTKLQEYINAFYDLHGTQVWRNPGCQSTFVSYMNGRLQASYSLAQIENMFSYLCNSPCPIKPCEFPNQFLLKRVVAAFYAANPQPWLLQNCQESFATFFNNYFGFHSGNSSFLDFDGIYNNYFKTFSEEGCVPDISNICNPPYTCDQLQQLVEEFNTGEHEPEPSVCQQEFVAYFNSIFGTSYDFSQVLLLYQNICGNAPSICGVGQECIDKIAFISDFQQQYLYNPTYCDEFGSDVDCEECLIQKYNAAFGASFQAWEELVKEYDDCGFRLTCDFTRREVIIPAETLRGFLEQFRGDYPDPVAQLGSECEQVFTALFNEQFQTQYSFIEISAYYLQQAKMALNVCGNHCSEMPGFISRFNQQYGGMKLPTAARRDLFVFEYNMAFLGSANGGELYEDPKEFDPAVGYTQISNMLEECLIVGNFLTGASGNSVYDADVLRALKQVYFIIHPNGVPDACQESFAGWFNQVMQKQYTFSSLFSLYNSVCGTNAGYICEAVPNEATEPFMYIDITGSSITGSAPPPMLCPIQDPPPVDPDPCHDLPQIAYHIAWENYHLYLESLVNSFDVAYQEKCLAAKDLESFTMTYQTSEYHYTLYYYDQAGNLVKTVPPAGVKKLSSAEIAEVQHKRRNVLSGQSEANNIKVPEHTLVTQYRYNTLGQVVEQKTPDGGLSKFYYDRLGRLCVSENEEQRQHEHYSYTLYDQLGRINEVGQLTSSQPITNSISRNAGDVSSSGSLAHWLHNKPADQITRTFYDVSYIDGQTTPLCPEYLCQENLRNRVSYTATYPSGTPGSYNEHTTATYYSYDIHGNVHTLLQDLNLEGFAYNMSGNTRVPTGNRYKKIQYEYDLISGKVNMVSYQPGFRDQFYHRYSYDAENRLTLVETSIDKFVWERDARYSYYKHGPLARTVLGALQVQGLDYAYTLQGWLKGVNSTSVGNGSHDIGKDGLAGSINSNIARDAFGFSLNYFEADYKPVSVAVSGTFASVTSSLPTLPNPGGEVMRAGSNLYNGNIRAMLVNIPKLGAAQLYGYRYDQLNRIVGMNSYTGLDNSSNQLTPVVSEDYKERVTYDPNGNILTYLRNGAQASQGLAMDRLGYQYPRNSQGQMISNQLRYVFDEAGGNYTNDIKNNAPAGISSQAALEAENLGVNQSGDYYKYDKIGNLVAEGSGTSGMEISWNVYGKISQIQKSNSLITYQYDAAGNRVSKTVDGKSSFYLRDASGNVMAIYEKDASQNSGHLTETEVHLYGSSRLGIFNRSVDMEIQPGSVTNTNFIRGNKFFELSNHLGNVLVTISDKKIQHVTNGVVDYYEAEVVTANDYYPGGMIMPGKNYSSASGYRYGFNGKELDKETVNSSTHDYGFRIYSPSICRFMSSDPLYKKYPMLTPYQFASNRPIDGVDLDGLEYITRRHLVDNNLNVIETSDIVYYEMDEKTLLAHGGTPKSSSNAAGYGPEGRGVKHEYYSISGAQVLKPVWEQKQDDVKNEIGFHGLYSGPGSITKNGLNKDDYDFSWKPIDPADAIAKIHDIQYFKAAPPENYQGFIEDTRTLDADNQMIARVRAFLRNNYLTFKPKNHQSQSAETIRAAVSQLLFIGGLAKYKEWKITKMKKLNLDINNVDHMQDDRVTLEAYKPSLLRRMFNSAARVQYANYLLLKSSK